MIVLNRIFKFLLIIVLPLGLYSQSFDSLKSTTNLEGDYANSVYRLRSGLALGLIYYPSSSDLGVSLFSKASDGEYGYGGIVNTISYNQFGQNYSGYLLSYYAEGQKKIYEDLHFFVRAKASLGLIENSSDAKNGLILGAHFGLNLNYKFLRFELGTDFIQPNSGNDASFIGIPFIYNSDSNGINGMVPSIYLKLEVSSY